MAKGNRTNHKRVYASEEDLKALKKRFFLFLDNDWKHLQLKIATFHGEYKGERRIVRILLGSILASLATIIALVVTGLVSL